jgi:NADPH-dependent glutamate synthase beta subunit-like oxidoreductase
MTTQGPTNGAGSQEQDVGAVLVCGGGIAGIQASLDLAESGFKVYLLEASSAIGGRMAQLDKTFPTGDCSMCILSPKLVECGRSKNIAIITLADVEKIDGRPGDFTVTIRRRPRFVDSAKCNACGECAEVCPVSLPNEFDRNLGERKAIFRPYPQAIPNVFGISKAEGIAPCKASCPAGVNAQGYVALVASGKFEEAYDLVRQRCPLPAVCGRICHHPCQDACNRKDIDEPVAVRDLKRFAADHVHAKRTNGARKRPAAPEPQKERIAIIGGGPAGLTAAHDLSNLGYRVTIFESRSFLGGMLRLGVPAYRLPRDVLDREIAELIDERVEVRLGTKLGKDVTIDGLKRAGYASVFVATGAHKSNPMSLPGGEARGVMYGLDMLCRVNLGERVEIGKKIVVVGGGNVAMDAARAALRLGAQKVTVVYRRGRAEMPALAEEIDQATEEGIEIRLLVNPVRVIAGDDGAVRSIVCEKTELGEPDASGRRKFLTVPGSDFEIDADAVILAIGQSADLEGIPLEGGKLPVSPALATSVPGVFAGGDVVLGPASLVEAMAHGHRAAESIHATLRGLPLPAAPEKAEFAKSPDPEAKPVPKQRMPRAQKAERTADFREIDQGYTAEQAIAEAKRCLACGLCSECGLCAKACGPRAILHDMKPTTETLRVGSIVSRRATKSSRHRCAASSAMGDMPTCYRACSSSGCSRPRAPPAVMSSAPRMAAR